MASLTALLSYIEGNSVFGQTKFEAAGFSLERRTWLLTNAGIVSDFFIDLDFIPNLKNTSELIINVCGNEGESTTLEIIILITLSPPVLAFQRH